MKIGGALLHHRFFLWDKVNVFEFMILFFRQHTDSVLPLFHLSPCNSDLLTEVALTQMQLLSSLLNEYRVGIVNELQVFVH